MPTQGPTVDTGYLRNKKWVVRGDLKSLRERPWRHNMNTSQLEMKRHIIRQLNKKQGLRTAPIGREFAIHVSDNFGLAPILVRGNYVKYHAEEDFDDMENYVEYRYDYLSDSNLNSSYGGTGSYGSTYQGAYQGGVHLNAGQPRSRPHTAKPASYGLISREEVLEYIGDRPKSAYLSGYRGAGPQSVQSPKTLLVNTGDYLDPAEYSAWDTKRSSPIPHATPAMARSGSKSNSRGGFQRTGYPVGQHHSHHDGVNLPDPGFGQAPGEGSRHGDHSTISEVTDDSDEFERQVYKAESSYYNRAVDARRQSGSRSGASKSATTRGQSGNKSSASRQQSARQSLTQSAGPQLDPAEEKKQMLAKVYGEDNQSDDEDTVLYVAQPKDERRRRMSMTEQYLEGVPDPQPKIVSKKRQEMTAAALAEGKSMNYKSDSNGQRRGAASYLPPGVVGSVGNPPHGVGVGNMCGSILVSSKEKNRMCASDSNLAQFRKPKRESIGPINVWKGERFETPTKITPEEVREKNREKRKSLVEMGSAGSAVSLGLGKYQTLLNQSQGHHSQGQSNQHLGGSTSGGSLGGPRSVSLASTTGVKRCPEFPTQVGSDQFQTQFGSDHFESQGGHNQYESGGQNRSSSGHYGSAPVQPGQYGGGMQYGSGPYSGCTPSQYGSGNMASQYSSGHGNMSYHGGSMGGSMVDPTINPYELSPIANVSGPVSGPSTPLLSGPSAQNYDSHSGQNYGLHLGSNSVSGHQGGFQTNSGFNEDPGFNELHPIEEGFEIETKDSSRDIYSSINQSVSLQPETILKNITNSVVARIESSASEDASVKKALNKRKETPFDPPLKSKAVDHPPEAVAPPEPAPPEVVDEIIVGVQQIEETRKNLSQKMESSSAEIPPEAIPETAGDSEEVVETKVDRDAAATVSESEDDVTGETKEVLENEPTIENNPKATPMADDEAASEAPAVNADSNAENADTKDNSSEANPENSNEAVIEPEKQRLNSHASNASQKSGKQVEDSVGRTASKSSYVSQNSGTSKVKQGEMQRTGSHASNQSQKSEKLGKGQTGAQPNTVKPASDAASSSSSDGPIERVEVDHGGADTADHIAKPDEPAGTTADHIAKPDEPAGSTANDIAKPDEPAGSTANDIATPNEPAESTPDNIAKNDAKELAIETINEQPTLSVADATPGRETEVSQSIIDEDSPTSAKIEGETVNSAPHAKNDVQAIQKQESNDGVSILIENSHQGMAPSLSPPPSLTDSQHRSEINVDSSPQRNGIISLSSGSSSLEAVGVDTTLPGTSVVKDISSPAGYSEEDFESD